jgi:hypothetical protein
MSWQIERGHPFGIPASGFKVDLGIEVLPSANWEAHGKLQAETNARPMHSEKITVRKRKRRQASKALRHAPIHQPTR